MPGKENYIGHYKKSVKRIKAKSEVTHILPYQIGREALVNAFRHSLAQKIETEITFARTELRLRVRDDGCGVDGEILGLGHPSGRWGLPGMYERARKIGAHLEVWSRPGLGTEVEVRVPASIAYCSSGKASRWQWLRRLATGGS